MLYDGGTLVVIGAPNTNHWLGPASHLLQVRLASMAASRKVATFIANVTKADLELLRELLEAGKIKPVIDRTYSLSDAPEAIRYLEAGHARAKVVLTV